MELYVLDSLYRRQSIIEDDISLIWTERYDKYGDFNLQVVANQANRALYVSGLRLGLSESDRVMIVDTYQAAQDDEGNYILTVTGYSLEGVMQNRMARGVLDDTTSDPNWVLTGLPQAIATQMFHDICVSGVLDPGDIIPSLTMGSIYPADTIPAPTDSITYSVAPTDLYTAETTLCSQYFLGFRIVKNGDTSQLYFDVYTGSDRTTHQTALAAVVFSSQFDNLQNTSELSSVASYKNVAYVVTPVGSAIVYADGVDPSVSGFDRRVLVVNNTDITDTDPPTALAQMIQLGKDQLALNRPTHAFDGEISQSTMYKYGTDYRLGDWVEVRSDDGSSNTMTVTEQIFARDSSGTRSYPTLVINEFVTPGSWDAIPPTLHWNDLSPTLYWEDWPDD